VPDRYDFSSIEPKWQQIWRARELFRTTESTDREKFYYLDMYPYPSGELHMGHVRNYIIGDVVARYMHMRGYNVMHPMGWDAFGLPAENAAIERQIHPAQWTEDCVGRMKDQFDRLGISYDWSREVNASAPDYYKWTQWLFLQLYHNGLAYRGEAAVNWCPSCQTVLANEELEGDLCERCGTPVERRQVAEQWYFAITKYAQRLLDDIEMLDDWPERVRVMQENWIGRSEGVQFKLPVDGRSDPIEVFTTRIDTIYGITFMALAPEHPLVNELTAGTEYEEPVQAFVREALAEGELARGSEEVEKRGIFTGAYCTHPLTGEKIPIWVTNYVLMEYGTGAIMAVPAHDQRDLEFARKYDIPVKVVIQPPGEELDATTMTEAWVEAGVQVNCDQFSGMDSAAAQEAIADYLEEQGIGRRAVNWRLRDWLLSRQRYWGCPIPIIYCEACGEVPVPEQDLPVLLPTDAEFEPTGESPLAQVDEFINTTCPRCGGPAQRETDTMTTFVDSSWYFLRYTSADAPDVPFRREAVDYWLPVDKYVGGIEHAVRHLLYARFITKVLHDLGHIGFSEPFAELFTQGMIYKDGAKMSKSKGNVVTPDEINARYGADTGRVFILFVGPPDQDAEWSDRGVEGAHRFLNRVWRLVAGNRDKFDPNWAEHLDTELDEAQRAIRRKVHQTIQSVSGDIEEMGLNTTVSALMELVNELLPFAEQTSAGEAVSCAVLSEGLQNLLLLLSPLAPHIADELWERLALPGTTYEQPWPAADEQIAAEEQITIAVQVNGKLRGTIQVPAGTDMERCQELAVQVESVQRHIAGKEIKRVIPVPNKLINIVVG